MEHELPDLTEAEKQFARELLARVPFNNLIGIELVEIERGEAICRLTVEAKHQRGGGFLHGGATASLIDTTTAFAVGSLVGSPGNAVTVDLTIHYLRPIFAAAVAKAKVVRAGKRLLTVSCEVFDEHEKLAATALTTYSKINLEK